MSEKKAKETEQDELVRGARGFLGKNSKLILIITSAIIIISAGYVGYKYFVQLPKEEKAQDEIFKAEAYFRRDSLSLALNGDISTSGFLKVIKKYDGTKTANLAKLYAGECYLQLGDFNNAVKYLKEFNANGAKQVEAKVAGLLGDAYSELKKNEEAIASYKKAGTLFDYDQSLSSEYLFRAGLLSELNGKTKEAAEMYRLIKEKYPRSEKGFLVEKYLARLGVNE